MSEEDNPGALPPEASRRVRRIVGAITRPVEKFLRIEASSGILLLIAAAIALLWANSPWASIYEHILEAPVSLGIGEYVFSRSVHFWINEILMVVFFFVIGLEVRRELHDGQLSEPRRAALPMAAALGGMLAPAVIYLWLNAGTPAIRGWGVPMATDIAFAVGALALLGRRVPPALRVLLLALAIIDDIGAIGVIALFYSAGIVWSGLIALGVGIAIVLLMQRVGLRNPWLYLVPGILIWGGTLQAGVHPTIAGVILGLLTPAVSWFGPERFVEATGRALDDLRELKDAKEDPHQLLPHLERVDLARREAIPPVTRIEAALHPWVAFGIMPLFALANAGVSLDGAGADTSEATGIALGIGLGLVVGKPLGVVALSWLAVRLGLASLPRGVSWGGVLVVGCVAGIGFTMALFIGSLAFADAAMLSVAKLSVLVSSALAGMIGLVVGLGVLRRVR